MRRIGGGSFGEIAIASHIATGEEVAVKLERADAPVEQLAFEANGYARLLQCAPSELAAPAVGGEPENRMPLGFPTILGADLSPTPPSGWRYLVMELLGPNLEQLRAAAPRGAFSVKTVLMLADQALQRLACMHTRAGQLHRDIKPDNFVMGRGARWNVVHLVDLGLVKPLRTPDGAHIPHATGKSTAGTLRYLSIRAHDREEQGCRDELESLGYVLLYLLRGSLPWQSPPRTGGTPAAREDPVAESARVRAAKAGTSGAALCAGFPAVFGQLVDYARGALAFEAVPPYEELLRCVREAAAGEGVTFDSAFDWTLEAPRPAPNAGDPAALASRAASSASETVAGPRGRAGAAGGRAVAGSRVSTPVPLK